jgi:hypothetical protein
MVAARRLALLFPGIAVAEVLQRPAVERFAGRIGKDRPGHFRNLDMEFRRHGRMDIVLNRARNIGFLWGIGRRERQGPRGEYRGHSQTACRCL